MIKHWMMKLGG